MDSTQTNSNLAKKGWIHEAGDDFDNYINEGRYVVSGGSNMDTMLNIPIGLAHIGYGILIICDAGSYKMQVTVCPKRLWFRFYAGSWDEWQEIQIQ